MQSSAREFQAFRHEAAPEVGQALDSSPARASATGSEKARPTHRTQQAAALPTRGPARPSVFIGIAIVLLSICAAGLPYYLLPISERVRSPYHPWFRPSGIIGQSAGLLAFAFLLFLWLYPLRKKYSWLRFTGAVGRWLDVHIVAGVTIPILGAVHAAWRFDGLIGLGYAAMLLVCLSGIMGKYLYARIPRARSGVELTLEEVEAQGKRLVQDISKALGVDEGEVERHLTPVATSGRHGILGILGGLVLNDYIRWKTTRVLRRQWRGLDPKRLRLGKATLSEVVRLARRRITLTQQVRMLEATHRLFRYWHAAHRPVAITALLAVLIHVGTSVALGVTWFW